MLAIYKKELKSYFTSMIGYIFIAFFLVVIGIYFTIYNLSYGYANFAYVLSSISFLFIILIPILTMKVMAEEKKQKTDQLLFTSPLSIEKVILGKYFALFTVFAMAMAVTLFYPLILTRFGKVELKIAYAAIMGFFLLGVAYIAIGMFISTLTENQMVSAVVSFVIILLATIMKGVANMLPSDNKSAWIIFAALFLIICILVHIMMGNKAVTISLGVIGELVLVGIYYTKPSIYDGLVSKVFNWFSINARFENFTLGILDVTSIIYYFSIIFVFLFMTVQAIKKRRWS